MDIRAAADRPASPDWFSVVDDSPARRNGWTEYNSTFSALWFCALFCCRVRRQQQSESDQTRYSLDSDSATAAHMCRSAGLITVRFMRPSPIGTDGRRRSCNCHARVCAAVRSSGGSAIRRESTACRPAMSGVGFVVHWSRSLTFQHCHVSYEQ